MGTSGRRETEVEVDQRVADSPSSNRTFDVPEVLSQRLDQIIERAARRTKVNRSEVVSALLLTLDPAPEHLDDLVRQYLDADVRACLLEPPSGMTVTVPLPGPGPRSRKH